MRESGGGVNKYEHIVNDLKKQIQEKVVFPEDKLPTEKELMEKYGVSKTTITKAFSILEHMNLIYRKQGAGTFVTKSMVDRKVYFTENNCFSKMDTQKTELVNIYESVDHVNNQLLKIKEVEKVYVVERIKYVNGQAFTLQRNFIPERYFSSFDFLTAKDGLSVSKNFYQHFQINTFNTEFEETIQIVDDISSEDLAKINLSIGTPVIKFYKKSFIDGKIYEIIETFLDYKHYQLTLKSF
ncbi:GntR family transcriptional regulator [Enterococcus crotali]